MIVDNLEELLQQTIQKDASVRGYVSFRVYPSEIALVEPQSFPAICFTLNSATLTYQGINGYVPGTIWVHSTKDYAEAFEIFDLLFGLLHSTRIFDERVRAVGRMTSGPTRYTDGEVFSLVSQWNFNAIETGV